MTELELVEELKREYVGKWVGLKDGRVVAVSGTHEELYREPRKKAINEVYVFYSPLRRRRNTTSRI